MSLSEEDSGKGNGPGSVGSGKWCFIFWGGGRGSSGEGSPFPCEAHGLKDGFGGKVRFLPVRTREEGLLEAALAAFIHLFGQAASRQTLLPVRTSSKIFHHSCFPFVLY